MPKFKRPRLLSDKELNVIRGKSIVGAASPEELMQVFGHLDILEEALDQTEDFFGTEGWRHHFDHPDAD